MLVGMLVGSGVSVAGNGVGVAVGAAGQAVQAVCTVPVSAEPFLINSLSSVPLETQNVLLGIISPYTLPNIVEDKPNTFVKLHKDVP